MESLQPRRGKNPTLDGQLIELELKDLLVLSKPPRWQVDSDTDRNSDLFAMVHKPGAFSDIFAHSE